MVVSVAVVVVPGVAVVVYAAVFTVAVLAVTFLMIFMLMPSSPVSLLSSPVSSLLMW